MLIEAKRFFGFEEPSLPNLVKIRAKLAINDLENYKNSHSANLRSGISTAIGCGLLSWKIFEHTDRKVILAKSHPLALTDEHIEYGRRLLTTDSGQERVKVSLWYIHGRSAPKELTTVLISQLREKGKNRILDDLNKQSAESVINKFNNVIKRTLA